MARSYRSRARGRIVMIVWTIAVVILGSLGVACAAAIDRGADKQAAGEDDRSVERDRMVASQIEARGVSHDAVLRAMRSVPRHRFVPPSMQAYAYHDGPLRIGYGQTISQPYIVALMTSVVRPEPGMKVLEIGTGSGYQAAILAECVGRVYTIEIVPELGASAAALLEELGYDNVHTRVGDGFDGWPEEAPFDAVVVTAAPATIPEPLLEQLAVGGRLVIPVGRASQELVLVTRTEDGYRRESVSPVRFVPMTGKAQERP